MTSSLSQEADWYAIQTILQEHGFAKSVPTVPYFGEASYRICKPSLEPLLAKGLLKLAYEQRTLRRQKEDDGSQVSV